LIFGEDLGETCVELFGVDSLNVCDGLEDIGKKVKFEGEFSEAIFVDL
jgi:hypothetical protein